MKPRIGRVSKWSQTENVQTGPVATMDDTAYTMDDSAVFMGGLVTIFSNIRAKTTIPDIRIVVQKRR